MNLKDLMADDMDKVFLSTDDFAEASTFVPATGGPGFSCTIVAGDPEVLWATLESGHADQRRAQFLGNLAALRAGILASEGAARDPHRGDLVVIASGAYAGSWFLERVGADVGGGATLYGRYEVRDEAGGSTGEGG